MKIHEYQGKELLKRYGVPVPKGRAALSLSEAEEAIRAIQQETGSPVVVVKAQIHAGGRGKGGGVKVAKGYEDAVAKAKAIFGMQLVTHQTGPEGTRVKRLLIEQGIDIARELYLGLVLDRVTGRVTVMASTEGGMEIEEVAAKHPEKIIKQSIDPAVGFRPWQAREIAFALGLKGDEIKSAVKFLTALVEAYHQLDCSLLEVNPLVVTRQGEVIALDAKINFDDNALYRHPDFSELRDLDEEDPSEIEAKRHDLSYIHLDGTIGCMVNGAGLAMSTMDIIKHYGGMPANFLDVGGGATAEKVTAAFKIITHDPRVRGIFVNIFGGIMKCDTIANGVVIAAKEVGLLGPGRRQGSERSEAREIPLVVRLEGTNVELGRQILRDSGLNVVSASDMADGAKKIVELAAKGAA
ncbi:MAG: ADP-forming succinate--CoA ligase subunit beta [Myxococcales bacterium]|nr:ADP-forming succinate--CoA ligase subunit beta [Myxococcales bacterium]